MIRIGLGIITIGLAAVILPVQIELVTLAGLVLIGIGCAPIYPCIIHETPKNFGAENSQAIIGIQMASAYTGSTFMPPIFGVLAKLQRFFISGYLTFFLILMIVMTERLNRLVVSKESR